MCKEPKNSVPFFTLKMQKYAISSGKIPIFSCENQMVFTTSSQ